MTAPLCRYCGKPIAKATERVWCYREAPQHNTTFVVGVFRSKADVQKTTNKQVVSVQYHDSDGSWGKAGDVWSFTTWDGASYRDDTFCNGEHAKLFAYAAARMTPMITTEAYREAVKAREVA